MPRGRKSIAGLYNRRLLEASSRRENDTIYAVASADFPIPESVRDDLIFPKFPGVTFVFPEPKDEKTGELQSNLELENWLKNSCYCTLCHSRFAELEDFHNHVGNLHAEELLDTCQNSSITPGWLAVSTQCSRCGFECKNHTELVTRHLARCKVQNKTLQCFDLMNIEVKLEEVIEDREGEEYEPEEEENEEEDEEDFPQPLFEGNSPPKFENIGAFEQCVRCAQYFKDETDLAKHEKQCEDMNIGHIENKRRSLKGKWDATTAGYDHQAVMQNGMKLSKFKDRGPPKLVPEGKRKKRVSFAEVKEEEEEEEESGTVNIPLQPTGKGAKVFRLTLTDLCVEH